MIKVSDELALHHDSPSLTDLPRSFAIDIRVGQREIDGFGHVNNARYIEWLDQVHWSHLAALGLTAERIFAEQCGFVVHHSDVTYLAPLLEGDLVRVGTAVSSFNGSYRLSRQFQLLRLHDQTTALRGTIDYVAVDLATGRPKRVPDTFARLLECTL